MLIDTYSQYSWENLTLMLSLFVDMIRYDKIRSVLFKISMSKQQIQHKV